MKLDIKERLLGNQIKDGNLYVLAGVKGAGTTTLALNIGEEYCKMSPEKKVLFFYASKNGEINRSDAPQIIYRDMSELPLRTAHILLEASWAKEDSGLAAVIVDDYRFLLRTEQIGERDITKGEKLLVILTRLKSLAEILDVPVIITGSVDDDYIWGRQDKYPRISDLPDYDYVETLADSIILLHRDDIFYKETEKKGLAEVVADDLTTGMNIVCRLAYDESLHKFFKVVD